MTRLLINLTPIAGSAWLALTALLMGADRVARACSHTIPALSFPVALAAAGLVIVAAVAGAVIRTALGDDPR